MFTRQSFKFRTYGLPVFLVVVLTCMAAFSTPVVAQGPENARERDAQWYAAHQHVSIEEARRRLDLQDPAGALNALLTEKEANTFAGTWIQHEPEFRIVVQFTANSEATLRPYLANSPLARSIEVRTARVPLTQLAVARDRAARTLDQIGAAADMATNVIENRVEVYVTDPAQLDAKLRQANAQFPPEVAVVKVASLAQPAANIYGGLGLSPGCTMGLSVRDGTGARFTTTAAHCDYAFSYGGVSLPLAGRAYYDFYDVSWLRPGSHTPVNLVKTGSTTTRTITSTKSRSATGIGETVCKYGSTTFYTCGRILRKDFRPSYVPNAAASFILFESTVAGIVKPGDSGGPVFYGNTGYGIISGYNGDYQGIYMSVDYLNQQGLTVLTN